MIWPCKSLITFHYFATSTNRSVNIILWSRQKLKLLFGCDLIKSGEDYLDFEEVLRSTAKMKFGKDLKRQMVPEWVEGYMDYYGLKRILQEIHISKAQKLTQTPIRTLQQWFTMYCPFKGVEIEESIRTRLLLPCEEIGRENEMKFFKKLDQELDKVNAFYRNKVDEVIKEAAELKKQLQAFIALRIKVQNSGIKASEAAVAVESLWSTTQGAYLILSKNIPTSNCY